MPSSSCSHLHATAPDCRNHATVSHPGSRGTTWAACAVLALCALLPGCTVITVASTAVSVTAGAVGLAADAAIGTAKIVGKGVGKAADALMDDKAPDNSGVNVRYRDAAPTPDTAAPTTGSAPGNAAYSYE